jgi:hypothetical protein
MEKVRIGDHVAVLRRRSHRPSKATGFASSRSLLVQQRAIWLSIYGFARGQVGGVGDEHAATPWPLHSRCATRTSRLRRIGLYQSTERKGPQGSVSDALLVSVFSRKATGCATVEIC